MISGCKKSEDPAVTSTQYVVLERNIIRSLRDLSQIYEMLFDLKMSLYI